jgi:hypothetical protein
MNVEYMDLAYIAGFVDADGHITIARRKRGYSDDNRYDAMVMVANLDEQTLRWIHSLFGGFLRLRKQQEPNWRPVWEWSLQTDPTVSLFLKQIIPFLRTKNQQAQVVLEFTTNVTKRSGHPPGPEETALREGYYWALRGLNKVGY